VRPQAFGHDHRHLGEYRVSCLLQLGILEAPHQARADSDRFHLVNGEHERRQVEALAQHVAHTRLALDRHAPRLQCGDISVDRARRHFEFARQGGCSHRPAGDAQVLDDVE
jgi:hypothetical protein